MKHFFTLLVLLTPIIVWAYDFESSGLFYNIISTNPNEVEVTYERSAYVADRYGDLIIPSIIDNNGKSYSVTAIGEYAFTGSDYASIKIPNSVRTIKPKAFYMSHTKSIEIPSSVTLIGAAAFFYCSKLESLTIPDNITVINDSTFFYSGLKKIKLPKTLIKIGDRAFYGCKKILSIDLPEKVIEIGKEPFYECSSLQSIKIPEGVESISKYAFFKCESLMSVILGNNISYIGDRAFQNCKNLYAIELPEKLDTLNKSVFLNCENLSYVYFPSCLKVIESNCFAGCSNLKNLTLKNIESIKTSAFSNCTGLEEVHINSSLDGEYIFSGCINLKRVYLGNIISALDSSTFNDCQSLVDIYVFNEDRTIDFRYGYIVGHDIVYLGNFYSNYLRNVTLHVPAHLRWEYQNDVVWKKAKEIVILSGESLGLNEVVQGAEVDTSFLLSGIKSNSNKNCHIIRYKDGTVKKYLKNK